MGKTRILVFDLETYRTRNAAAVKAICQEALDKEPARNTKKELKTAWNTEEARQARADEALAKTAVDPLLAEVLCCCIVADGAEHTVDAMRVTEDVALAELAELMKALSGPETIWTGHNIQSFDLAILLNRWRRHGILPPPHFPTFNNGHWRGRVFDTMTRTPSKTGFVSLDDASMAYGVETAVPPTWNGGLMCGARVGEAFRANQYDMILDYCMSDVRTNYQLYLAMTARDRFGTYDAKSEVAAEIEKVEASELSEAQKALAIVSIMDKAGLIPRAA